MIVAERYHDFSYGHRVAGHESRCAMLHGHNGRAVFTCQAPELDSLGRVIDFSVIKSTLCEFLENEWDHRFLAWEKDPLMKALDGSVEACEMLGDSIVWTPFNPTAENLANHLLLVVGPAVLPPEVKLIRVQLWETRKCSATAEL